jgi:myo-inositol-1(or 4)-monophosphatase
LITRYFRQPDLVVDAKADSSPVTAADREAEELLRRRIRARFPEHGIFGEEFGTERGDAEYVWVLDPIDGTISFVAGVPLFGTLIGLMQGGRPILGVIHQPITKELLVGTASGTTLNGRPVRVSDTNSLEEATLLTTDPGLIERYKSLDRFEVLRSRTGQYRGWGDCYGYLLVATARADIMIDPIMNPWDLIPLVPVIQGAGGVITTWEGNDPVHGNSAVASTPALHRQVLEILNRSSDRS